MNIDFQSYFPAVTSKENELRGYEMAGDSIKDQVVPIVTLMRRGTNTTLEETLDVVLDAVSERPVIIDFDVGLKPVHSDDVYELRAEKRRKAKEEKGIISRPLTEKQKAAGLRRREAARAATIAFNNHVTELRSPDNSYGNWRALSRLAPNIIPIIQTDEADQARAHMESLIAVGRKFAFRVKTQDPLSIPAFLAVAGGLSAPGLCVLILDFDYIRSGYQHARRLLAETVPNIVAGLGRQVFEAMTKVFISGSFPMFLEDVPSPMSIIERSLYEDGKALIPSLRYGDYASVQHRDVQSMATSWRPHVDVAHPQEWHFRRGEVSEESDDYMELANDLVEDPQVWGGRADCWGTETIWRAANQNLTSPEGLKMTSPGPWLSVRVNQHICQQARAS